MRARTRGLPNSRPPLALTYRQLLEALCETFCATSVKSPWAAREVCGGHLSLVHVGEPPSGCLARSCHSDHRWGAATQKPEPTQFEFFTRNDHRPRTIVPERDLQQSRGHGCEIGREGECTTVTNPVD